jgi:hypothetical protein
MDAHYQAGKEDVLASVVCVKRLTADAELPSEEFIALGASSHSAFDEAYTTSALRFPVWMH